MSVLICIKILNLTGLSLASQKISSENLILALVSGPVHMGSVTFGSQGVRIGGDFGQ